MIVYADGTKFDSVRFKVGFAYAEVTEEPVPLRFENRAGREIAVVPDVDCRASPETCTRLKTTDFAMEFPLW